jgi:hypothetical protein
VRVVLLHQHLGPDDDRVAALLHERLAEAGHEVLVDRCAYGHEDWAVRLQGAIEEADAVVPLISRQSALDEVLGFEVEQAQEAQRRRKGRPVLLPVRIRYEGPLPGSWAPILDGIPYQLWDGDYSEAGLVAEVEEALVHLPEGAEPAPRSRPHGSHWVMNMSKVPLEPVGGAVPLTSKFYIQRPADQEMLNAVARFDSIVLIKGARQMGKTSLLGRGLDAGRQRGAKVALTDFQGFDFSNLESLSTLYLSLAESLADQLELPVQPSEQWDDHRGANMNFNRFLRREVLSKTEEKLVWGLDEVDRLLATDYATQVFALFRSYYNERATDPGGLWSRLCLLIGHATEPHLFITDINQSPFNVGTSLNLDDFTPEQVGELNELHGRPLKGREELNEFIQLVGGHPYLVRRGLHEIVSRNLDIGMFKARAASEEWIFGDHLRRIQMILASDSELTEVARNSLGGPSSEGATDLDNGYYRLQSAGVLAGSSPDNMRPRCQLYATYLKRHLL